MVVLLLVAVLWAGAHSAPYPGPAFYHGSIVAGDEVHSHDR